MGIKPFGVLVVRRAARVVTSSQGVHGLLNFPPAITCSACFHSGQRSACLISNADRRRD